ncbi:hypothetical protein GCM10027589_53200 [Actinocorallia lasiicapitis]
MWWAAALLTVAGCASPNQFEGAVATGSMPVGSCHRFSDPYELYVASDIAPPVPCDTPHQTETIGFAKVPKVMAAMPERPERPADLAGPACDAIGYKRIRTYMGADELDAQYGVDIWMKFPTRDEWKDGLRVVRCDLIPSYQGGPIGPSVSQPLQGVLRRADSARFRHCRDGMKDVTCDRAHTAEHVGGWNALDGKRYPGAKKAAAKLADQCWRNAEQYTSGAVGRGDLKVTTSGLSLAQWRRGTRTSDCWVVNVTGRTSGTLRAGLIGESDR